MKNYSELFAQRNSESFEDIENLKSRYEKRKNNIDRATNTLFILGVLSWLYGLLSGNGFLIIIITVILGVIYFGLEKLLYYLTNLSFDKKQKILMNELIHEAKMFAIGEYYQDLTEAISKVFSLNIDFREKLKNFLRDQDDWIQEYEDEENEEDEKIIYFDGGGYTLDYMAYKDQRMEIIAPKAKYYLTGWELGDDLGWKFYFETIGPTGTVYKVEKIVYV